MDVQWLIDAIGKLGPASVATAVFIAALAQNRWVNRVARRSAAVEDQKVGLSLLDRRIAVLNDYDEVRASWALTGEVSGQMITKLQRVILSAELVFPAEIHQLEECRKHLLLMRQADRALNRQHPTDAERERAIEAAIAQDAVLANAMDTLRRRLVDAAKVKPVDALPPSLLDRFSGKIGR